MPGVSKALTGPGLPDLLRGDDLRLLDANPAMVAAALGQPVGEGDRIACVMPGHTGSGWVEQEADGCFAYRCECDGLRRSLNEVYIRRVTGKRAPSEFVYLLWQFRRAARARLVELPPSPLPPPEVGAFPEPVEAVYQGLRLLLRVRQLTEQRDEPSFTFTASFASAWCDVSEEHAKRAIASLRKDGVLVVVDRVAVGGGRANRYRLGVAE